MSDRKIVILNEKLKYCIFENVMTVIGEYVRYSIRLDKIVAIDYPGNLIRYVSTENKISVASETIQCLYHYYTGEELV